MTECCNQDQVVASVLLYDPRIGGHHLSWLRYVAEFFLDAGVDLSLAVDLRQGSREIYECHIPHILKRTKIVSVYDDRGKFRGGSKIASLAACLEESGAEQLFMNNFDEVASSMLRRAAMAVFPPEKLKGRLSGIYFRPRFMSSLLRPPGNLIKHIGFSRLCAGGWFNHIFLLDEYFVGPAGHKWPSCNFHFLPDVWDGNFGGDRDQACRVLGIPDHRHVFLFFGIGTRRKGIHLVIEAMLGGDLPDSYFLLCAGALADDQEIRNGLAAIEKQGRGMVLNRYVDKREEELCFAACDVVLLPYVRHFGSSGVLSRAAAAGKMALASDEGLLARRVSEHGLGILFRSGNAAALRNAMSDAIRTLSIWDQDQAVSYARKCSRRAFNSALSGFLPLTEKL